MHTAVAWLRLAGGVAGWGGTGSKIGHGKCCVSYFVSPTFARSATDPASRSPRDKDTERSLRNDCALEGSVGKIPRGVSLVLIIWLKLTGSYRVSKLNYRTILTTLP